MSYSKTRVRSMETGEVSYKIDLFKPKREYPKYLRKKDHFTFMLFCSVALLEPLNAGAFINVWYCC
jgi:hypothetical protein